MQKDKKKRLKKNQTVSQNKKTISNDQKDTRYNKQIFKKIDKMKKYGNDEKPENRWTNLEK